MEVPHARRLARPSWINARTALGVLLFSITFLGVQRLLADARDTVSVWAAASDLPRDIALGESDLVAVEVKLPPKLLARYLPVSENIQGEVLTRSIDAGELVPSGGVATGAGDSPGRAMTIPVSPEHALGGSLAPGDRVDVLATFDAGDVRARTVPLVSDVEIIETVVAGGLVTGEEAVTGVTVAVAPKEAARLVFAIRTADIDLIRVEGPAEGPERTVTASDVQ
jgi:Flp pilus assembly protein CpaB